jgi:hypothetical protein
MYQIELSKPRKKRVNFTAQEKDTLAREMLKMKRKWEGVDERLACRRAMEKVRLVVSSLSLSSSEMSVADFFFSLSYHTAPQDTRARDVGSTPPLLSRRV